MRRKTYFPNTEPLADDEMRVVALGTGRPFLRRSQANTCWLVELGNGDRFMFDFGNGSQMNFTALEIPYADITAYFASHLHTDHVGDFCQIWVGSWAGGRTEPLVVYGPSGLEPKYGTKHFVESQVSAFSWDTISRVGLLPASGADVEVHEFDYATPQVVYEKNGVTIRSYPAVHIFDGPVSYRLDWNGLSFVFSGDTTPNSIFIEHSQNADLLIHETFNTVGQLMRGSGYDEKTAIGIGTKAHSAPAEVGEVLARTAPRMAVLYHFYNDFDTEAEVEAEVRQRYDGPLALARDFMVFNVTKDEIAVRLAEFSDHVWPNTVHHKTFRGAVREERVKLSDWLYASQLFPK